MPKFKVPQSLTDLSSQQLALLVFDVVCRSETQSQETHEKPLKTYLLSLPNMVIHQIMDKSIGLYVKFKHVDMVNLLQHGYYDNDDRCILPRLASLFQLQVVPLVTHLDFTKLVRLGTLSSGCFTYFHQVLTQCLENVPHLQYLNLKSPNSRTSLPSMSSEHLRLLGDKCAKLKHL